MHDRVVLERGSESGYDIVSEGRTDPADAADRARARAAEWEAAGATWWIEALWGSESDAARLAAVEDRIQAGPVRST